MTEPKGRWLDDYVEGDVHELGCIEVDESSLIEFSRQFDPQPFHIDPQAARDGFYGGIIASGWHTSALMMSLYASRFLDPASSIVSPGVDRLRWLKPVRGGDRLSVRVTVVSVRPSRSRPDRGLVETEVEVRDERDQVVMTLGATNFIRRDPGQSATSG